MASIVIAIFTTDNCLYGQSTTDNNLGAGGKYLGYFNNFPLFTRTNGTTRMTILNGSGFVGIGNNFTNPQYRLDVRDDINITLPASTANRSYRINGRTVLQVRGTLV